MYFCNQLLSELLINVKNRATPYFKKNLSLRKQCKVTLRVVCEYHDQLKNNSECMGVVIRITVRTEPVGLKSDGTTGQTTGHLEVDMPWATCDGRTTGHWSVALFKRRDRR